MGNLIERTRDTLPTGTVTFLFTDIQGSTALAHSFPDQMPALLERHHGIMYRSIQAHHGYIFQIVGDAFCAAFFTAPDALNAALAAQQSLQNEAWDPAPVRVRMGIHTGMAQVSDKDDRSEGYSGYLTLAHTQGVMSSAHGGQVLLSGVSAELVHEYLPQGVLLRDLGEHLLKGGTDPERLWQLVAGDLLSEFPPLKTQSVLSNNLPVQFNRFVGRERELAQTKELLANTHLLTLIGPGGTGKTRLVIQLAWEVLASFAEGVWMVELAPLADPALVLQTVAETLGLREVPGAALFDLVTNYLCAKNLLLILDNCEHLVESCASLADRLLRHCPNLKIITSSREALGIAGETVFRVPPLALPDQGDKDLEVLRRSEAVQLFVERAVTVRSGFDLSEYNAPAVAQICLRLDGIPLALELAAARVRMLTPQQIATRLDDRFRLLTGGSRTALPRQQTLRSLIDWSYELLSEPERQLFCRLAVFVGGWSLEAAEAVCPDLDVLELLGQLVQKSLVAAEVGEQAAATRFRLLETIRQYARDRLLEKDTAAQARDLHLEYYLKFAEAGEPNIFGPRRLEWVDQCELEHDNFRAALQWGLDNNIEAALRLGGSLATFWGARGFMMEGHRWLQAALDQAVSSPEPRPAARLQRQVALAKGLLGISQISYGSGDYRSGLEASQQAVSLYRQIGDWFGLGFALGYVGNMAAFQNDIVLAEQALNEAIQLAREHDNKLILPFALGVMSKYIYMPRGDLELARAYAEESGIYSQEIGLSWSVAQTELILAQIASIERKWDEARQHCMAAEEVYRELRDPLLVNMTYSELGDVELRAGNLAEAQLLHQRCLVIWQEMGQQAFVAHELESFAFIAQRQNQAERAERLLGAAEALRERIGTSAIGVGRLEKEYESAVSWLHSQFDETAYPAHWSEGCAMTMDQAISYALEQ